MRLNPSSADIWTKCSAQPSMMVNVTRTPPSDAALEGTCASWLAEMVIKGEAPDCQSMIGEKCPESGWTVDVEMADHIQNYVDLIMSGSTVVAETYITLTDNIAGYADAVILNYDAITVYDLKYGRGVVEPTTKQLLIYAAAIAKTMGPDDHRGFILGIYQPRAHHPLGIHRFIEMTKEEVLLEARSVYAAEKRALGDQTSFSPGKHCKRCRAASMCAAVTHNLYEMFDMLSDDLIIPNNPSDVSDKLDFLSLLEDVTKGFKSALHAEAEAMIESGKQVPNWVLRGSYGNRKFNHDANVITALTGVSAIDSRPCSPAELERRGVHKDIVNALSHKPKTKTKLSRISRNEVEQTFNQKEK